MRQSLISAVAAAVITAVAIPALTLADGHGHSPPHKPPSPHGFSPIQRRVAELSKELQQAMSNIQSLSSTEAQQQNMLSQDQQQIQTLSDRVQTEADQIDGLQQTVSSQGQQISNLQNDLNALASQIQQLNNSGSRTVTVRELAANGQPLFVGLTLVPIHGGPAIGYSAADSNVGAGIVAFPNVPDGSYTLVTAAPEYQINQPKTLTLQGTGTTNVNLELTTDIYAVSGIAETPSGSPVLDAPISLSDPSGHAWSYGWTTSNNGTFSIDDLPPGTYTIHIGTPVRDSTTFTVTNANFNLGILR